MAALRHPDIEILTAVAGSSVNKPSSSVVCNVTTVQHWHCEGVPQGLKWMAARQLIELVGIYIPNYLKFDLCGCGNFASKLVC